jgi:hypothetical protein
MKRIKESLAEADLRKVRVYGHMTSNPNTGNRRLVLMALNFMHDKGVVLDLSRYSYERAEGYAISAPNVFGKVVQINGREIARKGCGKDCSMVMDLSRPVKEKRMELAPLGAAFIVLEGYE